MRARDQYMTDFAEAVQELSIEYGIDSIQMSASKTFARARSRTSELKTVSLCGGHPDAMPELLAAAAERVALHARAWAEGHSTTTQREGTAER